VDEHVPVLVEEVLEGLAPRAGGLYVDGTFGRGGHTARLLEVIGPEGAVLALDRDPAAIEAGKRRFADEPRLTLIQAEFPELARVVDEPLDMRMDPSSGEPAALLVNSACESELARIFREYGEEPQSRRVARAIVAERERLPFTRTAQLAALIEKVLGRRGRVHPATPRRTFRTRRDRLASAARRTRHRRADLCLRRSAAGRAHAGGMRRQSARSLRETALRRPHRRAGAAGVDETRTTGAIA